MVWVLFFIISSIGYEKIMNIEITFTKIYNNFVALTKESHNR